MRKELFTDLLKVEGRLDTLRLMPHKIEGGIVYDFNGNAMFNVSNSDTNIMDTDVIKSRYTDALKKKYLSCLDKVDFDITGGTTATDGETAPDVLTLGDQLLEEVAAGDKKAVRATCKKLKEKYLSCLDSDDVEDAIDDIKDCVSDKDVEAVKDILDGLDGLDGDDAPAEVVEPITKEKVVADIKEKRANVKNKISETAQEIIEDIETAIKDNDGDDLKELLGELADEVGEDSDLYKKYVNQEVEEPEVDTTEADEIILDLEDCVAKGDLEDAKEYLKELADEVGEDSDLYIKWAAKVAPKKRERRGEK